MYLSDGDLEKAIKEGSLIVSPFTKADPTSIDLHLDKMDHAKIWDIAAFREDNENRGGEPLELPIGRFKYGNFSRKYLCDPPEIDDPKTFVWKRTSQRQVIVKPGGFVLWQTREIVGTPESEACHILFVDGKSTRTARTGLEHFSIRPSANAIAKVCSWL